MVNRMPQSVLIIALLTVSIVFSLSPSWSGTERFLAQPGLQILKSEMMAIIVTIDESQPAAPAVEPGAGHRFNLPLTAVDQS